MQVLAVESDRSLGDMCIKKKKEKERKIYHNKGSYHGIQVQQRIQATSNLTQYLSGFLAKMTNWQV